MEPCGIIHIIMVILRGNTKENKLLSSGSCPHSPSLEFIFKIIKKKLFIIINYY